MKTNLTLILTICCLAFSHIPSSSAQTGVDDIEGVWNTTLIPNPVSGITLYSGGLIQDNNLPPLSIINFPDSTDFNGIISFGVPGGDPTIGPNDASSIAPEPSTISLVAVSAIVLVFWRRRRAALQKV